MEWSQLFQVLLFANFVLGLIALWIKSEILADYWPSPATVIPDYDDEEIVIRNEKIKKFGLNAIFGIIVIWEALFYLLMYQLHPNPKGK